MPNFDEAVVEQPDGSQQHLTYEEFFKLPLITRVKALSELRVRFFKAGARVPAVDAMK